jgi:hypothetical protein
MQPWIRLYLHCLAVAGALGFGTDPLVELIFNGTHPSEQSDEVKLSRIFYLRCRGQHRYFAKVFGALALADFGG